MSAPQDYPDFTRVEQWVGGPLVSDVQAAIPAGTSFGSFYVGSFEALAFDIAQTGGAGTPFSIGFAYRATSAGPILATYSYVALTGQRITDIIPVSGLFVTLTIQGWAGTRDFVVNVIPRRGFTSFGRLSGVQSLVFNPGTPVGAGANFTQRLNPVMAAHCTLTIFTDAATWHVAAYILDIAGGVVGVCGTARDRGAGAGPSSFAIDTPGQPVDLVFTNDGGVACTLYSAIVPQRS